MPLTNGTKLGPYEIVAPIGAGGMGEVYRARDTRLNRDVAIKVLPALFASDADRLHRFEQEARAVGALNHPNIMAVHDIGEDAGSPYLVTELLEGETLRERLQGGAPPMRKALDYGVQVAAGLAAAHEKGVVHRDLKPENIYVTNDGRVKILDFGLAKLSPSRAAGGEQTLATRDARTEVQTHPVQTQPGAVLGTVGYMSPEQVRGMPADARSDCFSLGTILYEMVSGQKPFQGDSAIETMNAILKEDPPELTTTSRAVPPVLERIIRRCLEKNPGERFQSARDLGFALEAISGASSSSGKAPAGISPPEKQRKWILPAAAILLVGLAAGFIVAYAAFRAPATAARISVTPMTFRAECIFNARFAADGATVVFSAAREGNVPELFVHRPDYPAPQPMGRQDTQLLAISSKGELAVLTGARFVAHFLFSGTLARMDMSGGAPRNVAQSIQDADWSPDGESLAIIREVNGLSRLEYPIGNVLFETAGYVSDMRFSPRGDQIAFFEHPFRYDDRGSVDVVDLKGGKKVLTGGYSGIQGLTWSFDGDSVYFGGAANGDTNYLIFAVTLSGKTRTVLASTDCLWPYDRDKKGNLLATGNSNQEIVNALAPGAAFERDVSWLASSGSPNLSPDGKQILFTENSSSANSNYSLLLGGTDGSPVARLGEGAALGISPDGQWALSLVPGPPSQIVMNAIGSGEKRVLPSGGIETYALGEYFPDGKRVLVCGNEAGHRSRCYVQEIAGGPPRPITPEGTGGGLVSPDGKSVLARDSDGKYFMYPVAGGAPVPVSWIGPDETVAQWTSDGRAILVFHQKEIPSRVEKIDMSTGHRTLVRILGPAGRAGALEIAAVSFSAGEKAYAYSYVKNISLLALIEGVK